MALDPSFIGRTYPPTAPYEVGREKIREFAEAVGDSNPVYLDAEAAKALGHPDVIAPPTFPFVLTYRAAAQVVNDPELGLDFSRVVPVDHASPTPARSGPGTGSWSPASSTRSSRWRATTSSPCAARSTMRAVSTWSPPT
jgi:hypothetical protein